VGCFWRQRQLEDLFEKVKLAETTYIYLKKMYNKLYEILREVGVEDES
jgi:hypothetical protein